VRCPDRPANAAGVATAPGVGGCDPSYAGVCVPPYPPDLDCSDLTINRFRVASADPHGFDSDGDGVACEG
jgi:micrococcal nuclease